MADGSAQTHSPAPRDSKQQGNHPVAIRLQGVSFAYDERPVLENVYFTLPTDELTCIVGPNGGGKSTLLHLLLGTLKPSQGTIEVFGRAPKQARRWIGYMPQSTHVDRLFPVSVGEIVLMGRLDRHWWGHYNHADKEAARRALAEVGLEDLWKRPFAALSGGQRQRVLIARALACEPRMLLLDEPTANVDAVAEGRLLELIQNLAKRMTVVMVSHDLGFVGEAVEHVLCVNRHVHEHPTSDINAGLIRELFGTPRQIVRHDRHIGEACAHHD